MRQSDRITGSYPSCLALAAAAAHNSRTLPVMWVSTLFSALGVSCPSSSMAWPDSFSPYRSTISRAWAQVEWSG